MEADGHVGSGRATVLTGEGRHRSGGGAHGGDSVPLGMSPRLEARWALYHLGKPTALLRCRFRPAALAMLRAWTMHRPQTPPPTSSVTPEMA
jgi:hypothetical protein